MVHALRIQPRFSHTAVPQPNQQPQPQRGVRIVVPNHERPHATHNLTGGEHCAASRGPTVLCLCTLTWAKTRVRIKWLGVRERVN